MRLTFALVVSSVLTLAGCGIVGEERAYYIEKEWHQFKSTDWLGIGGDVSGYNEAFPSAKRKEQLAEQQICLHTNSGNRVTTQNGVSDQFAYRRCVLAPYDTQGGSRMGIRPDGNGTVIR
jgi:hypothetical protein